MRVRHPLFSHIQIHISALAGRRAYSRRACIATTRSISGSSSSASRSSATRRGASSPGSCPKTISSPLRLRNGLYIQKHAPMLRVSIPYGLLSTRAGAHARAHRARVRPRLRSLHDAAEHPVQLAEAGAGAGHPGAARDGRDACDPDQRQLHPQRDRRSSRRHRAGRARRSAAVVRDTSASGRRCIPNSRTCRASSRSP